MTYVVLKIKKIESEVVNISVGHSVYLILIIQIIMAFSGKKPTFPFF